MKISYMILPHCSTHSESLTYVCISTDQIAMHVALCLEKQEVCEICADTVEWMNRLIPFDRQSSIFDVSTIRTNQWQPCKLNCLKYFLWFVSLCFCFSTCKQELGRSPTGLWTQSWRTVISTNISFASMIVKYRLMLYFYITRWQFIN